MQFHMPTLLIMLVVASATLTLAVGWVARQHSREGLSLWTWGLSLGTLAIVLLGFRGVIPDLVSIIMGNVLLSCTYALFLGALFQLQQRRLFAALCWLPPLIIAVSFPLLMSDVHDRIMVSGAVFIAQHLLILWFLFAPGGLAHGRGKHLLAAACMIMIAIVAYRTLAIFFGATVISDIRQGVPIQALLFIVSFMALLLGSNGFVLMVKEDADQRFRRQSQKDTLTGVWARAYLEDLGRQEISRHRRYAHPVSLVMIDIDHFKQINDRFGHVMGDQVLMEFCRVAQKCIRDTDALGRWGGEEFLLILPNTGFSSATELAERIRSALEIHAFPMAQPLTASFGVSLLQASESWEDWLQRTDVLLYRAKATGRNRVAADDGRQAPRREQVADVMIGPPPTMATRGADAADACPSGVEA
jgi:diguanylate cyclase (GGDEF)-like protein